MNRRLFVAALIGLFPASLKARLASASTMQNQLKGKWVHFEINGLTKTRVGPPFPCRTVTFSGACYDHSDPVTLDGTLPLLIRDDRLDLFEPGKRYRVTIAEIPDSNPPHDGQSEVHSTIKRW